GPPGHAELLDRAGDRRSNVSREPSAHPEALDGARDRRSDASGGVEGPAVTHPLSPGPASAAARIPSAPNPTSGATPARRGAVDRPFREQVEDAEREIILAALAYTHDNVTEAAKLLDLERGHFYKKMKALGLRRRGGEKEG